MSDASSNPVLSAHGLAKSFVSGERILTVLQNIELAVMAGESVSIRGESGSGKSTLLHLLAGLDDLDAGEVRWAGQADLGAARRGRFLGMVFQAYYLIPAIDALANVLMGARMVGRVGSAERDATAATAPTVVEATGDAGSRARISVRA